MWESDEPPTSPANLKPTRKGVLEHPGYLIVLVLALLVVAILTIWRSIHRNLSPIKISPVTVQHQGPTLTATNAQVEQAPVVAPVEKPLATQPLPPAKSDPINPKPDADSQDDNNQSQDDDTSPHRDDAPESTRGSKKAPVIFRQGLFSELFDR